MPLHNFIKFLFIPNFIITYYMKLFRFLMPHTPFSQTSYQVPRLLQSLYFFRAITETYSPPRLIENYPQYKKFILSFQFSSESLQQPLPPASPSPTPAPLPPPTLTRATSPAPHQHLILHPHYNLPYPSPHNQRP